MSDASQKWIFQNRPEANAAARAILRENRSICGVISFRVGSAYRICWYRNRKHMSAAVARHEIKGCEPQQIEFGA